MNRSFRTGFKVADAPHGDLSIRIWAYVRHLNQKALDDEYTDAFGSTKEVNFGEYGNPSEWRAGASVFPWKNQVVRWNTELIYLNRSPVGALSPPYRPAATAPCSTPISR